MHYVIYGTWVVVEWLIQHDAKPSAVLHHKTTPLVT